MSRSLHTDPYRLRAARRVSAPYRRRSHEPRVVRRLARQAAGMAEHSGSELVDQLPSRVTVRACPARPGFFHPVDETDIGSVLDFFGPRASYGLRGVELRHAITRNPSSLTVARLLVPGLIVLYEQKQPPWTFHGRLAASTVSRLRRAGARLDVGATTTRVEWPANTLRDFVLFDGLMHEIGHHIVQSTAGNGCAQVMRTADHERRADAFAAACRLAWVAGGAPR